MIRLLTLAAACLLAAPAMAGTLVTKPVPAEGQTVRYEQGLPTIEDDMPGAAVSVLSAKGLDHGSLTFKVAVYNKSATPVNVGVENISITHNGVTETCFTVDELAKRAKNRAMWSQIGYAMLAGAAAAAQNNQTTITTYAPRGRIYRTVIDRPGLSGGQTAAIAAGGGAIALSQIGLQKTLAQLEDEVIQTTTIDQDEGYGGRVVAKKLKNAKPGDVVTMTVVVGQESHVFRFTLAKA